MGKYGKRLANKTVRRYLKKNLDNSADGCWYKRVTNPWDIYDVVSYCPKNKFPKSLEGDGYEWHKFYLWK